MNAGKIQVSMEDLSCLFIEMLEQSTDVSLTVTGNSMFPLLADKRDSVILSKCNKWSLKKGDIPLYKRSNGRYILHRIVKVNKDSYDLCGDNQYIVEKGLPKENIIAVVKSCERNGKLICCASLAYKAYWHIIVVLMPFRRMMHMVWSILRRMF